MDTRSDEDLIRAIQHGDLLAFEFLVKRYQSKLLSFVLRIVFDQYAAEEIVQDAFVSLYKTIDRVDTAKRFSTYVFTITKHRAYSYLRSKKHTVSIEVANLVDIDESIYERLIREEEKKEILSAIQSLPKHYRQVLTFYYYDDISYEEIARKLHMPINTVRTHLKRGKELLKKAIIL